MAQTAQQSQAQQAALQVQQRKNRDFFKYSAEQCINANAQNGTAYVPGQLMNFDVPIIAGAYATKIRVYTTINFTSSASTYTNTAGGMYNAYSDVTVNFGNKQMTIHPYIAKVLAQLRGYNRTPAGQVLGNLSASVQSGVFSQPAIVAAGGANVWKGYFDLPTTLIHPLSPFGLIPIGGSGTRMQIQLTPNNAFLGADPLNNLATSAGAITAITGTVQVVVYYRSFISMTTPQALEADLSGLPTAQIIKLRDIAPLTAGQPNYLSITNPYPFNKIISIIMDGNQSSSFAAAANIQAFRIDGAENTGSALRVYDASTGGMNGYFTRQREVYGQDLDDGVIVYDANGENTTQADDQDGEAWLNASQTGFPAARLGFQVGTVSSASFAPRISSWGVILNPVGIN